MDASPLQPAESPSVPNASAPADTRGDGPGPGPGPGLGPDPTHDGSSSYRHRNSFPPPADGSLGPRSRGDGDDSQYGGIPRIGAKRRYIDISYSLNPGFPDPPSVSAVGRLGDDESSECGTVVHLDPTTTSSPSWSMSAATIAFLQKVWKRHLLPVPRWIPSLPRRCRSP